MANDRETTEYIELKRSVDLLELGMYVSRLDRPWEETDFLFQGFQINTQDELQALREQCQFVFVRAKKRKLVSPKTGKIKEEKIVYINKVSLNEELNVARSAYKNACEQTGLIMDSLRLSGEIDAKQVSTVVNDCVSSILRNDTAMIWLTQIQNKDAYTAEHSLRVCIFSIALGRHLGLRELELQNIGTCGLLHDVGKVKIPEDIIKKAAILNEKEKKLFEQHTVFGKKLLISRPGIYAGAVDVAYCHHERNDGSGYPRGVTGERIPSYAKLVAIVDTYDSMISERRGHKVSTSLEACSKIYQGKDSLYDKEMLEHFIRLIGIYSPGSLVEMNTGEVGIIVQVNNSDGIKPKILLVLGSDKQPKNQRTIDLAKGDLSFTNTAYTI